MSSSVLGHYSSSLWDWSSQLHRACHLEKRFELSFFLDIPHPLPFFVTGPPSSCLLLHVLSHDQDFSKAHPQRRYDVYDHPVQVLTLAFSHET